MSTASDDTTKTGAIGWFRRIGVAGFLFFLVKGLLWLTVPMAIAWMR